MISLKNINLRRGAKVLLDDASVVIQPGEKVGLVGKNGAGKSTLLRLLDGSLHEDRGELFLPAQWRLAQVEQEMPETAASATDFVLAGDTRLMELRDGLEHLERRGDGMALADQYALLADAGDHDALARAQALILGLGFAVEQLDQAVNSFSGGWRMRLQLARALMCPSDLMLLDEPTNHLDLDALVWLETWLKKYTGTLLVISHDREFLDAVTKVTLHIEQAQLLRYSGNYSAFEDMRAERLRLQQTSMERQQDKIAHLQKFIDRFKAKASKARQAQSRVKALERMERIAPVLANAEFSFEFLEPERMPNPLLTVREADLGYPIDGVEGGKTILRAVDRTVLAGQRIGILGANGQGKSTLVKTLARELSALRGEVAAGKGLRIGYFAQQELDLLRPHDSALEHLKSLARELAQNGQTGLPGSTEQSLRGFLGGFLFSGDMVMQAVGNMSGGEKARLVLAMIVWQRPNLLLLDEPTNHLDLAAREALSVALNEFEGTVLLVSHDRALLRTVCDGFWLVSRGGVKDFDGDLDDYQAFLVDEARRQREAARVQSRPAKATPSGTAQKTGGKAAPAAARANASPSTLKRQFALAEQALQRLNQERDQLEARLSMDSSPGELAKTGNRHHQVQQDIVRVEAQWLALAEQIEAARG
jgi:ATP-binding cassette subfamily F protein 3